MSTRSVVIVKIGKSYQGIHCHWDAEGVGKTLKKHFNNEKSAKAIVALGDCSVIDRCVRINPIGEHSFDNPEEGTIVAYHRDRGGSLDIEKGRSWRNVASKVEHNGWAHVWEKGKWTTYNNSNYSNSEAWIIYDEQRLDKFKEKNYEEALKLIYEWVKKDIITFKMFRKYVEEAANEAANNEKREAQSSMNDEGRKNISKAIAERKEGLGNGKKCPKLGLGECPWTYCDLPKSQEFCSP